MPDALKQVGQVPAPAPSAPQPPTYDFARGLAGRTASKNIREVTDTLQALWMYRHWALSYRQANMHNPAERYEKLANLMANSIRQHYPEMAQYIDHPEKAPGHQDDIANILGMDAKYAPAEQNSIVPPISPIGPKP